ncbi:MAG: hypothetical protein IKP09_09080 [Lentisphaeria bacterium]|nr:hypothetical protein [Lentisphaeria bacterium]
MAIKNGNTGGRGSNSNALGDAAEECLKKMFSKDPKQRKQGYIGCLIIIIVLGIIMYMISH